MPTSPAPLTVLFLVVAAIPFIYYGIAIYSCLRFFGRPANRQMQSIERLTLTAQHSLHLVSFAGRTLLIAVSPAGCSLLDDGLGRDSRANNP